MTGYVLWLKGLERLRKCFPTISTGYEFQRLDPVRIKDIIRIYVSIRTGPYSLTITYVASTASVYVVVTHPYVIYELWCLRV